MLLQFILTSQFSYLIALELGLLYIGVLIIIAFTYPGDLGPALIEAIIEGEATD